MNIIFEFIKDAKIITELSKVVYDDHKKYYPDMFNDFIFEDRLLLYENVLKKETSYSIIAFDDKKPVGFIFFIEHLFPSTIFKNDFKSYFIDSMAVIPGYQRKGIGGELLNRIKIFAKKQGINRIDLYVWSLNNKGVNFYSKLGFKEEIKGLVLNF